MESDFKNDDEIGSTSISVKSLCAGKDEWFDLQYDDKSAGTIHLKSEFIPMTKSALKCMKIAK